MNRTLSIREVFSELRKYLEGAASARDALSFASELVLFYARQTNPLYEDEEGVATETLTAGRAFEEWPVDLAMRDGGWMILEYEMDQNRLEHEIGRVQLYDASSRYVHRLYAAESQTADLEGDRIQPRSLDWLLVDKMTSDRVTFEIGYDDYTGASMDGLDFEG